MCALQIWEDSSEFPRFLLHFSLALYMCYALALVCEDFFVAALDIIVEKLKLPPDVAGATFMVLPNPYDLHDLDLPARLPFPPRGDFPGCSTSRWALSLTWCASLTRPRKVDTFGTRRSLSCLVAGGRIVLAGALRGRGRRLHHTRPSRGWRESDQPPGPPERSNAAAGTKL